MTSQNFWSRFGLQWGDRKICIEAVRDRYGDCEVEEFEDQGYCSCTLLVTPSRIGCIMEDGKSEVIAERKFENGPALIVQLRPPQHAFDRDIVRAASTGYPTLVPVIRHLDLTLPQGIRAYEMEKVNGIPLSRLRPHEPSLDADAKHIKRLVTSFADLIAQAWHSPQESQPVPRTARADSPMDKGPLMLSQCRGKVGSTIVSRLEMLASKLPDAYLRKRAAETMRAVQRIQGYPVVLNHGDLIPSNILVDQNTWKITGLVDWAEAEDLPFGTCLYALEHLIGYLAPAHCELAPTWFYIDGATQLRELFWSHLIDAVPELQARMRDIKMMRDMGVLLWYGIAWDDGAIDRVVDEVHDVEELVKLRAYLTAG
jgi:hypothetical protein